MGLEYKIPLNNVKTLPQTDVVCAEQVVVVSEAQHVLWQAQSNEKKLFTYSYHTCGENGESSVTKIVKMLMKNKWMIWIWVKDVS